MEQNVLEQILEGSMKPTHLPLETLRKITDGFSSDRIIGEGGFGTVYKGIIGNRNVAVKRIRSSMTINQKLFRREVDSQMEVNHENVVRFLGLCSHTVETPMKNPESQGYIYAEIRERLLCFEYVSNGSLDNYITDELRGLDWDKRYKIIKGICTGLHYLHMEKHILHMDLKPANILLDNQMVPKITDFGLSRSVENAQTMTTNNFSSLGYSAPENLFGRGTMSVKSDMYSLGAIIIELVTGRKGIPDDNNNVLRRWRHRWNKSAKETPLEYHHQVIGCIEIGSLCLNYDPYARPSISQTLSKFVEMESTEINPLYWDDDMLGVEPMVLQFRYNKEEQILSCSVELSNGTDGSIAFKIETTSPLPYSIEPNMDIVKPRSKYSVEITLPVASTDDHKAALPYSTTNKQYSEDFIVRSIKVNEGLTTKEINQNMFGKHREGHHVDEIHLAVVSEESWSEEVINFPSKEAKKQNASSGIRPGSVQLLMKNNKKAPLLEYKQKVMLELTAGDYTIGRPGLDLVAVLDVSGSMVGDKMDQLKTAMRFVIRKLSPIDRLSVVTFSNAATRLCPLQQMTEASQQELQQLIDGLQAGGYTNIEDGLRTGYDVLADRKISDGRVAGIILVSDGHQTPISNAGVVDIGDVPVYTFGFGVDSDPVVLSMVAAKSIGGTFSHLDDTGSLTMAFSQCLAGLLTVSVQDLKLTMAAVGDNSRILKVTAVSYPQTQEGELVTVSFSNLYSREVRKVIVELLLPATQLEGSTDILHVTYSHSRSTGSMRFVAPPVVLSVWRTARGISEEEMLLPAELRMEESRLQMMNMIQEARHMAESDELDDARNKLVDAQNMLEDAGDQSDPQLMTELLELLEHMKTRETYEELGLPYALSFLSSHGLQRFTARGGNIEIIRLFATQRMDMYLEQAKKFPDDPDMLLTSSVDDDANEEEEAEVLVARREEEMQRLSLEMED